MKLLGLCVMLITFLASGWASADDGVARKHYERGLKSYNLQEFKVALEEFKAAYVERSDAVFLFNIGQCQRQLGQYEAASKSYRAYLNQSPDAPNRDEVSRLVHQMDQAASEARAKEPAPAAVTPQTGVVEQPAVAPSHTDVRTQPPRVEDRGHRKKVWTVVGVVAGVVVVGAAVGLAVGLTQHASTSYPSTMPTNGVFHF